VRPTGTTEGLQRPGIVVRRARPVDWEQLKALRLSALAESPTAFGSSLATEEGFEDEDWRDWTREAATFIAFHGSVPAGMAAGTEADDPDERKLVAAWVAPGHRRLGAASGLVTAVVHWALEDGARRLTLWVTGSNRSALGLYRRHGFTATGRSRPLPSNPELAEDQLVLELR
jgi:ribosomal protein S18 acetylase RimI-like enzyme